MYWLTGLLGAVSLLAPFLFNYTDNAGALWTSLIIGALLVVDSLVEGMQEDKYRWEYVVAIVLGIIAVAAPFILGFSAVTGALWTLLIVGVVTVLGAGSRLTSGELR